MADYNFRAIEKKWQAKWAATSAYKVSLDTSKPKFYVLDMFPYPSGAGLHVGHPLGYIASDIYSRFKKLKGFNVLHPMGYDSFGLPAEQYAIQTGQHPVVTTEANTATYRKQLDNIGFSFDWSREVRTSDPSYYKWTQWIFGLLFNAWFDNKEQKAKPISELETYLSQYGSQALDTAADEDVFEITANEWNAFSEKEKANYLMNYRLAFLKDTTVNWCPALGTVLANEEVKDGVSERGGYPVIRKTMQQWCLRITAYSERLLAGLDNLDWTDAVKEMQRNWIGKSVGATVHFPVQNSEQNITVFTTRVDTIFGVTFLSLAPEYENLDSLVTAEQKGAVTEYVTKAKNRSERDRMADVKTISGVFTGSYAINPFSGELVPIWIADYVLAGYGTGAVMAVPCSDTRDYAFANHFNLPIIKVQEGANTDISQPDFDPKAGTMINSGFLNGLTVKESITTAINYAVEKNIGVAKVNFRFRDAIFSRQRYWGEPFPIYYKDGIPLLMDNAALPLELPEVDAFKPTETGEPPLARAQNWHTAEGDHFETNTMPGWAGSSWYFFRYMDAQNSDAFASPEALAYWKQVDLYIGGTEHATGHLLYARFWTKFLYDLGYVNVDEPFKKLVNQGMIQGVSEKATALVINSEYPIESTPYNSRMIFVSEGVNPDGLISVPHAKIDVSVDINLVNGSVTINQIKKSTIDIPALCNWRNEYADAAFVVEGGFWKNNTYHSKGTEGTDQFITYQVVEKMSKSKYNVVNPDEIIERYGADTFRLYEMFLGPLEQSKPWNTNGIEGTYKFLRKVWRLFYSDEGKWLVTDESASPEELRALHKLIKKVGEDVENLSFNTSVPAFMMCVNELQTLGYHKRAILEPLLITLAAYAPHITEELWEALGNITSITQASFPEWNPAYLEESTYECPVSINGKTRAKLTLPRNLTNDEVQAIVLADEQVQKFLEGKEVKKIIVVPNRIVNIAVG